MERTDYLRLSIKFDKEPSLAYILLKYNMKKALL